MRRLYYSFVTMVLGLTTVSGQEFDLTFASNETFSQTHIARNSITLGPNYCYTPLGGSMTIGIQNPVVNGPVAYNSTVDPEIRTINTSYFVGATSGSFNVSPVGGASYTIPLELLPGVNDLAPVLSLVYSSNSGPGLAGFGWQLGGLSMISRGPKTYYHDGIAKGVDLDTTDRFYIDGQRLVTTNSYPYGNALAEYQTDIDIFTRVKPYGSEGNGPSYFKAETKSGLIFEYGNTTASKHKINGNSNVANWYVSKISDLFGNQINFAYIQDNFNIYPVEITYGPNKITFYYKGKTDKNASYYKGTKIEQWLILDKITVQYNTTIIKTYEFKYNLLSTNYNSFSTLNEIVEYGIGTSRVNSTAITYQMPDNVTFGRTTNNTTDTYLTYSSKLYTGDFNGDGRADIICLPSGANSGWRLYLNNGGDNYSLSTSGQFSISESTISDIKSTDLNGDNKDDLVITVGSGLNRSYYYVMSYGTTFGSDIWIVNINQNSQYLRKELKQTKGGDINGDGLNEINIVDFDNNAVKVYSYLYNNGQLYSVALRNTLTFSPALNANDKIYFLDFNGDGKADIWKLTNTGINIYTISGSSLALIFTATFPDINHFLTFGDYNGDGKGDILIYGYKNGTTEYDWTTWQLLQSNGSSFETFLIPQKKSNLKNDIIRQGDFNGDGSTDLMITANSDNGWTGHYYYISQNQGTGFYSNYYSAGQLPSNKYCIDDLDGDGRDDYLCTDGVDPWTNGYMIYKSPGRTNVLMSKIGNGLGFLTKPVFVKLSQAPSYIYQRGTGASFPVTDYQGSLSVVDSVKYDNGKGGMNIQKYYYEGVKIHRQGKGLLGVSKTMVSEIATGIERIELYSFHTTYYFPQLIQSFSKRILIADTLEKVTNIWANVVFNANNKRIFPYLQKSIKINKLAGYIVIDSLAYDNYGNPSTIKKRYDNGVKQTTTNTYNNTVSTTKWLLGRPTSTTIEYIGNGNTITRTGTRVFDSNNNHLKSETWFALTGNQIWHRFQYYNYGNIQKEIDSISGNVTRSVQYTYEANKVRVQTKTDPLLHLTTYAYDTYGRLFTQQDYLNNIITYQYDDLNRTYIVSTTDGNKSTTIYGWENQSPSPKGKYSIQTTGNNGSKIKRWYDNIAREIRSDVQGFNGTMIYTVTKYNIKGQIDSISDPYYSNKSPLWNRFLYDVYGRKTNAYSPSGRNSSWSYSGKTITEITAGRSFSKTFASDGTLSSANDPGGTITYTYYPDGKVKTILAPGNITTSMYYDPAGNQSQLVDPSAGTITYSYNGFGELTHQQNGRAQTTDLTYYPDGRPYQKILQIEGTTTYFYNSNKQLTSISSPGGITRAFGYDTKGRIASVTETIPGSSSFTSLFKYDKFGRDSTITHPTGIVEKKIYNSFGYQSAITAAGKTRWTTTSVNAWQQDTTGIYGNNYNVVFGHNKYGYPTSTKTTSISDGTIIQDFQYSFNVVTGNLNYRKNAKTGINIQENFLYDNLDRLTKVYRGATALLRMRYEGNKGGITTKSDIGVLGYNRPDKPYVVSQIDSCSQLTPSSAQTITYTSFESVGTISENNYIASFTYNAENERAKMVVQQGGSTILTRWYPSSNFIKETAGSTTKEYTFIGGDAYTAPCVAIKQGTSTKFYYILRDYLGSITQIVDTVKNILYKYNYDVWGRIRRDTTWVNYSPGQEPDLFIAGRGFTGHEHLKWFNLINMNGRLYDPLTGQFVSADNFIQAPGYTQSYNRFGYCLNNPLKYTDPTGEDWNTWLIAGIIGAVSNVIAHWDDINGDFIKFNQYAFVGLVAGSTSAAMMESGIGAPAAGICGGGILNSGNAYIQGARGYDLIEANTQGMIAGGISGFAISGLSELLKIPINVKTHSGLVEPGTLKPQTAQISLGDWLFGSRSSQIDNIINSQGATNAAQLLPPNVRSLDLGLLPKPSLRSMYENSSLEFMGNLTNYTKGRQYVDGLLMWVNHYADGSISVTDTWVAISGPWDDIISLGDHTIRNGFMGENTGLISYQRSGSDFYIDIFPNPRYEIHPDGNTWGTNGCIGVHDTGPRLNNLFNIIKSYVGRNNELQLNVIY